MKFNHYLQKINFQKIGYILGFAGGQFFLSALPSLANCTINVPNGMNFGVYDALNAAALTATTNMSYTCTNVTGQGALKNVSIFLGAGSSGSYNPRAMARVGGGATIQYNLYQDTATTVPWGDGTNGTNQLTFNVPPNGQPQTVTIYGRIFPLQNVWSGEYVDTITVTIDW